MSAERLREAAKVLRERAEAATTGPWVFSETETDGQGHLYWVHSMPRSYTSDVAEVIATRGDAALITLLRQIPEPLADWLDDLADHDASESMPMERGAYVIADLILGDNR